MRLDYQEDGLRCFACGRPAHTPAPAQNAGNGPSAKAETPNAANAVRAARFWDGSHQTHYADKAGVSHGQLSQALIVLDRSPELAQEVERGNMSLSKAYEQVRKARDT